MIIKPIFYSPQNIENMFKRRKWAPRSVWLWLQQHVVAVFREYCSHLVWCRVLAAHQPWVVFFGIFHAKCSQLLKGLGCRQAEMQAFKWRADGGRMAARLCSVCLFFPNRISSSRNLFFQVASVILNERLGSFTYSCFFTQLERSPAFVHAWWTGAVFNVKMSVVHFNPYHGRYYETCFPLVQKCQVNT